MSFFTVISADEISKGSTPISLKVVQSNGVDVTPDLNITVNNLNSGNKHFLNNGYGGISFKIDVIINKNDKFGNSSVTDKLHQWITTMTPLYVVTEAIDVKNGRYIISKNSNRKQTFKENTVWTLEFIEFKGINITKFKNNNKYVNKAKKNYKKAKAKAKKASENATNKKKLKKCKTSNLKYGAKKSNCVKYMQKVLYNKGFLKKKQIDGHFGSKTKNALKKFQKKYKKKYKLNANGKVDKATLKALVSV